MAIEIRLDMMLAKRKMALKELAQTFASRHSTRSVKRWIVSREISWNIFLNQGST
jgi:hypothetical protein